MAKAAEKKVKAKVEEVDSSADFQQPPSPAAESAPPPPNKGQVESNLSCLSSIKNWLLDSFHLMTSDPEEASRQFRSKLTTLMETNPGFANIMSDAPVNPEDEGLIDFGEMGAFIRKTESEQQQIQSELEKLPKTKRRPGRPFGSTGTGTGKQGKSKKRKGRDGEGDGDLLLTPEKPKKKNPKIQPGEERPGDPFFDCEDRLPNKSAVIPLHAKCLVVEFAKKLVLENQVDKVEHEVMIRFKKYFWSAENERWKTGLLHKWTKLLVSSLESFSSCMYIFTLFLHVWI